MLNEELNRISLSLSKRAESYDDEHLERTFVSIGNIPTLLSNNDSAIIFGRRGTGKTHLLSFINKSVQKNGFVVIPIDMRTIGSSSGLYADHSIPLPERATRLLRDTANTIYDRILETYTSPGNQRFGSDIVNAINALSDAASEVKVEGEVVNESLASSENNQTLGNKFSIGYPKISFDVDNKDASAQSQTLKQEVSGRPIARINFGSLSTAVSHVVANLPNKRLWLLLDEWSEVPLDLQPYLADMLRRGFLSVRGVTAKFAAIEHRSSFRTVSSDGAFSIGIELGADVSTSLNLDDHMVFENDPHAASEFFSEMLFRHINASAEKDNINFTVKNRTELISLMFTQKDAFDEFVKASEGVARDAINILSKCALKANNDKISTPIVRDSARNWFMSSKHNDVSSRDSAYKLLQWIIDEVIKGRKARGFLLNVKSRDPLIDFLFDNRVIHLVKRSISSNEDPGEKFNAFTLDYGCYVELINSSAAPRGLFEAVEEEATGTIKYIDVPQTDYRSIRRAILDLNKFHGRVSV
jgi:hypothetical protein